MSQEPLRTTRQRSAIEEVLGRTGGFRTAQELHEELRAAGHKIGLATVYRSLRVLAEANQVDVLRSDEGEAIYRRCEASDHHHHIVCRSCGHAAEIQSEAIERWAKETARSSGFTSVTHTAELYGVCRSCTKGTASSR